MSCKVVVWWYSFDRTWSQGSSSGAESLLIGCRREEILVGRYADPSGVREKIEHTVIIVIATAVKRW